MHCRVNLQCSYIRRPLILSKCLLNREKKLFIAALIASIVFLLFFSFRKRNRLRQHLEIASNKTVYHDASSRKPALTLLTTRRKQRVIQLYSTDSNRNEFVDISNHIRDESISLLKETCTLRSKDQNLFFLQCYLSIRTITQEIEQ